MHPQARRSMTLHEFNWKTEVLQASEPVLAVARRSRLGGKTGVGCPVKRKYLSNTHEKKNRRCQVEHPGSCDPYKRYSSSWPDAHRCNYRKALKHKKNELATLNTTGGAPEDVFVGHA